MATVDLSSAQPGRRLFHLSPERVKAPFAVAVTQVTPSSVAIRFEPSATRIVPVQPSVEGEPAAGFIVGKISADPPTVEVIGPESVLRRVTEAITEPYGSGRREPMYVRASIVGVADEGVRLKSVEDRRRHRGDRAGAGRTAADRRAGARTKSGRRPVGDDYAADGEGARARSQRKPSTKIRDTSIVAYVDLEGIGEGDYGLPVRLEPTADVGVDQLDPTIVEHSRRMTHTFSALTESEARRARFPSTCRRCGASARRW